jgi:hypothetical protein
MLNIPPAPSNAERQRKFRRANSGYYARLQAKRRAAAKPRGIVAGLSAAPPTSTLLPPAPVETVEIPGMTTIYQIDDTACPQRVAIIFGE